MSEHPDPRRDALLSEIEFLERNLKSLERDRARLPWFCLLPLLAIPAGIVFNWLAAIAAFFGGIAIAITWAYLVSGHRSEYAQKLEATRRALEEHERRGVARTS